MKALAFTQLSTQSEASPPVTRHQMLAKLQVVGAIVGLAGGVAAAFLGALLITVGWFVTNDAIQRWVSTTGSVLLCLIIPLIILAAYCLDWMEKGQPQRWSKVVRYDDDDEL